MVNIIIFQSIGPFFMHGKPKDVTIAFHRILVTMDLQ